MNKTMKNVLKLKSGKSYTVKVESYSSAQDVVRDLRNRTIRHSEYDMSCSDKIKKQFCGVDSYDDALSLLNNGYQPTVDKLKASLKINKAGESKRIAFRNNVYGFAPVVPLALKGVPNSMVDMTMKPIKCKVIDVYYDMGVCAHVSPEDIIKSGQKLLATIIELENQGYRFNLYALQGYSGDNDTDILCVEVKSSDKPIDIKRISFPLTHPAFFRVIGFDWQSKSPITKYRGVGRGRAFTDTIYNKDDITNIIKTSFGDNAVYLACNEIYRRDEEHIKEVLTNESKSK